jgi:hypothetical protein
MDYIPVFIRSAQAQLPRSVISHLDWNNLFNSLIMQGDNNSEALNKMINEHSVNLGHRIVTSGGTVLPMKTYLRFTNSQVSVDGETVNVHGLTGPVGPVGPEGPQGIQGEKGDTGNSFIIHGIYPTLLSLETAVPVGEDGDAYFVGDEVNNTVYMWDSVSEGWSNVGPIRGPQGPQGPQGIQGPQGPQGPEGPAGDTTMFNDHIGNMTMHITAGERTTWNSKSNLALGETSTNAYRGDRGKIAYDHSQSAHQTIISGAATTVVSSNLTVSRVVVSDAAGKLAASSITSTILGYLSGLSSNVQTQLNGKLGTAATAADSNKVGGRKITVSPTAPSGPATGDVWIQY